VTASPLRIAFLGCGFIANIHSRHLRILGGVTRAYASRDRAKAERYRRRHGGVAAYGSYAEAIADPATDAVVIAVPPSLHLPLTLEALAAGKHVLVEKPAFPSLADYHTAMDGTRGFLLHDALRIVWQGVTRGNEYVDRRAPWKQAKDPALRGELETTLASLIRQLARQAVLVAPFMPERAQELWSQLGAPGTVAEQRYDALVALDVAGWRVRKGEPLFPKEKPAA